MKSVAIEILMKDGLTSGLKKAGSTFRQFSGESTAALREVSEAIKLQKEHVESLEKTLTDLEQSMNSVASGKEWDSTKNRVEAVKKELDAQRAELDKLVDIQHQLRDASEEADISLRQQLRNLTQEIATLRMEYARLSEEEKASADGQAMARHIDELTEKAGILRDAMADTASAINNAASDTRGLDQLSGALRLAADGFGLATAGAQMFGASEEDLAEAQTKLQAALVASAALSSVQNNLQRESALMQGISIIQTKAAATAENIKTAAQGKGIIVTKAATLAQAGFNAVAKANPYVLLAGAILTGVGALYAYTKGSKAAKVAEEERQKAIKKAKEEQEEFVANVATGASQQIAAYYKLKRAWENLGDSFDKKKQFITETKEEWKKLGKEINMVNDMEAIFKEGTDGMLKAIVLRAEMEAYQSRIRKISEDMVSEIEGSKEVKYEAVKAGALTGSGRGMGAGGHHDFQKLTEDERAAVGGHITSWRSKDGTTEGTNITEEGARIVNAMRAEAAEAAAAKKVAEIKAGAKEEIAEVVKDLNELGAEYERVMTELPGRTVEADENGEKSDKGEGSEGSERLEAERRAAEELRKLRWKNEEAEIAQMAEGAEKRRRQIALDYEKEDAEIKAQARRWREGQGGKLTGEQDEAIRKARGLAYERMMNGYKDVEADEVKRSKEKLQGLLAKYKDYDQRRRDIEMSYRGDMEVLNKELARREAEGLDTTAVKSAISAREAAYRESISSLEKEILQSSDFYDKLFGRVSERGYKVLKDFYGQAKETLEGAKVAGDGVEISIPVKDGEGKFVKKAVKVTVEEYRRMVKQVDEIRKELEKDNPFGAMRRSWSELNKAMKEDGDVSGALKDLNSKGKEVTGTIRGWSESLGTAFGDNFKRSMDEITGFCEGMIDIGTGIAGIWSGDIVGGITGTLRGLSSIVSLFTSWKEKAEEMRREWYIAEVETNRTIRERTAEYARSRSEIAGIVKEAELLSWLVDRGFSKGSTVSVWEAESGALEEYMKNLREETGGYDELWGKLQGSEGHYEWGNSLNGGSATWSLQGANAEMIELWYNQGKLSDEARAYYEAWKESGESIDELVGKIEEAKGSLREMVTGVSFDSFLSNSAGVLKKMRGDVKELGRFTEDTLAEAILNGFMYKDLAVVLEPLYNELSDALIEGTADGSYLEDWRQRYEAVMTGANERLEALAGATGVNLDGGSGTTQRGKAGTYTAMSQDQGTKLEGIGTSIQMHTASIDVKMDDVAERMGDATECLRRIEGNTAKAAEKLERIADDIEVIKRDGIRTR